METEETKVVAPTQSAPVENKPEPQRPRFTGGGLKNLLQKQTEANAEANKNLPELQEKLKEQIKVHEPKQPRKQNEEGQKEAEEDDEFDKVEEKKRDQGNARRGGRGTGRGGRGGFHGDEHNEGGDREHHENKGFGRGGRPDRPREERPFPNKGKQGEHKHKNGEPSEDAIKAAPVKTPDIVAHKPQSTVEFDGWGKNVNFF